MSDTTLSARDIAERLGTCTENAVNGWSKKFNWHEKREAHFAEISRQVEQKSLVQRVNALVEWNQNDLILAKEIRRQAAVLIQTLRNTPSGQKYIPGHSINLRTIAQVLELTQRIARTAIGIGHKGFNGVGDYSPDEMEADDSITSVTVNIRSARIRQDGAELELVTEDGTDDNLGDGSFLSAK